jgi:hypothetical protein
MTELVVKWLAAPRLLQLEEDRDILIAYLEQQMREQDWHGVQDAASDLRDLDVEMETLRRYG